MKHICNIKEPNTCILQDKETKKFCGKPNLPCDHREIDQIKLTLEELVRAVRDVTDIYTPPSADYVSKLRYALVNYEKACRGELIESEKRLQRYDLLVYRNDQGSGAKVIDCDNGPFVKYEDVKEHLKDVFELLKECARTFEYYAKNHKAKLDKYCEDNNLENSSSLSVDEEVRFGYDERKEKYLINRELTDKCNRILKKEQF